MDSKIDYRYSTDAEETRIQTYVHPVDSKTDEMLNKAFQKVSNGEKG